MDLQGSFRDQYFLVNFIMSTYLGPDIKSDNPRCSAFQRLAEGWPPYTLKDLGRSFVSISQLESLYYYVTRNADPRLVLEPKLLHMYLKGNLPLPDSGLPEDSGQFTSFFPLNLHEQTRYRASLKVKGVVIIDDPVTSYMIEEDLKKFKHLSRMDDLKIDPDKCLHYQHGRRADNEEGEQGQTTAGNVPKRNGNSSAKFKQQSKKRHLCELLPMATVTIPKRQSTKGAFHRTCNSDGPSMMPLISILNIEECDSDASIVLSGTAGEGIAGPPVGVVDIGVSEAAYYFQVALPGVKRDCCNFSCEIECDGKVHIQGSTTGGKTIKKLSRVFEMKFQQLCPPGPFTLSFSLPGPVDPRLFSPNFRSDGIFEGVVVKLE